jgi:hypothetical protein
MMTRLTRLIVTLFAMASAGLFFLSGIYTGGAEVRGSIGQVGHQTTDSLIALSCFLIALVLFCAAVLSMDERE